MTAKNDIRNQARASRMQISEKDFADWNAAICDRLLNLDELQKAQQVHAFWPIHAKREVDIRSVIAILHANGKHIWLPVSHGAELSHGLYTGESDLTEGKFGVMEPVPVSEGALPEFDLILVPALSADLSGHRIGYGKGYYDRFLSRSRAVKVVPIFENQLVDGIPAEDHDVPVDMVVTERAVHQTNKV